MKFSSKMIALVAILLAVSLALGGWTVVSPRPAARIRPITSS